MWNAAKAQIDAEAKAPKYAVTLPNTDALVKAEVSVDAINKALVTLALKTESLQKTLAVSEGLIKQISKATDELDAVEQRIILLLESKLKTIE